MNKGEVIKRTVPFKFPKAFELRQLSDYKTIDPVSKEIAKETMDKVVIFVGAVKKRS